MKEIALKAKKRETGKQISKRLRREGSVPGVFYMGGEAGIPILVEPLDLRPIVYTAAKKIVSLEVEGIAKPFSCVLKDVKFDPVTDNITHFDLIGLAPDTKITVEVPITLKGQAVGVRQGGTLRHTLHKVSITCLPADLIDALHIDISKLEMGKSIHIKNMDYPNVTFNAPADAIICAVKAPRGGAKAE